MERWFGQVRWCNEDLMSALEEHGYPATKENVEKLRNMCDNHWFTDHMIAAGWDYINNSILDNNDLKR